MSGHRLAAPEPCYEDCPEHTDNGAMCDQCVYRAEGDTGE